MKECDFCGSLAFYLDLLKTTLRHSRFDSSIARTAFDNLAAMINGYVSGGSPRYSGNWKLYKNNCYVTEEAKVLLLEHPQKFLHMEHVVPICVIWKNLLTKFGKTKNYDDVQILLYIKKYLVPCLMTTDQRVELDKKFKACMGIDIKGHPDELSDAKREEWIWSRYKETYIDNNRYNLFDHVKLVKKPPLMTKKTDCIGQPLCLMISLAQLLPDIPAETKFSAS